MKPRARSTEPKAFESRAHEKKHRFLARGSRAQLLNDSWAYRLNCSRLIIQLTTDD